MLITVANRSIAADAQVRIVTTTGMISDIVANIVPEHFSVKNVIREGVDPHLFQATRSDFVDFQKADVVYYNGLHLEGKLTTTFERLQRSGKPVIAVAEFADVPHEREEADPHIWMDPALWIDVVDGIAAHLSELYAEDADSIRARHEKYRAQLQQLVAYGNGIMASIPEDQRVLVTAHDAFYYFGKAYGVEVLGLQGISTESEAGLLHVEQITATLVERRINAIFVESTVSQRGIEALVQGAARQGHTVRIGGKLYSDAMGAPNTYEGTYIGMIEHNVNTIAAALGGTVPQGSGEAH